MLRVHYRSMSALRLWLAVVALACTSCTPVAEADVLLELMPFDAASEGPFRDPKAWLEILDAEDNFAWVDVAYGDGGQVRVRSPLPVPCDETGRCALQFRIRPQTVTFRLRIEAADRCGSRADVVHFESVTRTLQPYQANRISFSQPDYEIDDDSDGVVNYAELLLCGRLNWSENARAPFHCKNGEDPCCAASSPLEGEMVYFAGGSHRLADGQIVPVSAFWLDATEVTWRQLKRCVAAGQCLNAQADHPVRKRMDGVTDLRLPVTGLNPAEAEELCAFYQKRLVRDREFDFAVAHREGSEERSRFPWDHDTKEIDCQPSEDIAANFSEPGVSCPGTPLPVGSYPTTYARRLGDVPLADLAGNVSEWTTSAPDEEIIPTFESGDVPSIPELPEGLSAVHLRGGGWHSPAILLENDIRVEVPYRGDISEWRDQIQRYTLLAGFRCGIEDSMYVGTESEPRCEEAP